MMSDFDIVITVVGIALLIAVVGWHHRAMHRSDPTPCPPALENITHPNWVRHDVLGVDTRRDIVRVDAVNPDVPIIASYNDTMSSATGTDTISYNWSASRLCGEIDHDFVEADPATAVVAQLAITDCHELAHAFDVCEGPDDDHVIRWDTALVDWVVDPTVVPDTAVEYIDAITEHGRRDGDRSDDETVTLNTLSQEAVTINVG